MALQPCADCRRPVSTRARACPHCGAPPPGEALLPAAGGGAGVQASVREAYGPAPGFWAAIRVLLRRLRIASYGAGSGLFAAILTGSVAVTIAPWTAGAGMLVAMILCMLGLVFELVETNLGKGGDHAG